MQKPAENNARIGAAKPVAGAGAAPLRHLKKWAFHRMMDAQHLWRGSRSRASATSPTLTIFKPDGIGDFVLATGAIRWLVRWARETHGLETRLIVANFTESLAKREFPDCQIVGIPFCEDKLRGGTWQAIRQARQTLPYLKSKILVSLRYQPTLVEDLFLTQISAENSFVLEGCPLAKPSGRYRFRATSIGQYPAATPAIPREISAHATLLSLLAQRPVPPSELAPRLISFPISDDGSLLVFPFAGSPIRECSPNQLREIFRNLDFSDVREIVLCAPPLAKIHLEALRVAFENLPVPCRIILSHSITEATELIAAAHTTFGMESGPAHLATALGKRGVFILGGGHHGFFAPWGNPQQQHWVDHPLACYYCGWHCPFPTTKCIVEIPTSEVTAAFRQIWEKTADHA